MKKQEFILFLFFLLIVSPVFPQQWSPITNNHIWNLNSGNVGIGTSNPRAPLHVMKTDSVNGAAVAAIFGNSAFEWTHFGGTTGGRIRGSYEGYLLLESNPNGTGDKNLYLNHTSAGNVVIARGGGNVGIGVLNPQHKLEVSGTTQTSTLIIERSNRIYDWNSMHESGFYTSDNTAANSPETNAWFWGINFGNTAGVSTNRNGAQIVIRHISSGNPVMYFRNRTQDGDGKWAKVLHDQGSQSINGGLTVDGTIKAREVKIQANVWSDFVFAPDYNLPSLQEVESFIKENNHLPGVPSEKEVLAEGIDLAAMNAVLLQKIEELTLYMIQQQQQIAGQKEEIIGQQQRIEKLETIISNNKQIK